MLDRFSMLEVWERNQENKKEIMISLSMLFE
jgi:hypothetical protein